MNMWSKEEEEEKRRKKSYFPKVEHMYRLTFQLIIETNLKTVGAAMLTYM